MLETPTLMSQPGVAMETGPGGGTITATRSLSGLATGRFAQPAVGVAWSRASLPADVEFLGFAFTQFALPVTAGADLAFDFRPAPGLRSPRAVSPLIARSEGRIWMIAPIDHFHEQIAAITDDAIVWGWHGDLDAAPTGFTTRFGIYQGATVNDVLGRWRTDLSIDPDLARPADNALSTHLSYWTDNGAAYWYRTEPRRSIAESVIDVVETLRADEVPVRSVELDSWFYPHATLRPIGEIGYPDDVPPTGMSTWSARADAYPATADDAGDPIEVFVDRLDRPPLVLHARHIAPSSPYVTDPAEWWVDEFAAHPIDPAFFRRWFDDAARWGATVIEQDWMLMSWFGVRQMRAVPGRAAVWQEALNAHAASTGVDLLWCMATPADLMLAASLDRVIAVRTCDDYRFAEDPALLWTWFLTVNRLANTLDLPAFKDCFFSNSHLDPVADPIDGDRHAELEALLAALSGGPVGIGDRIGRTDRDIVMRTCDADGRIRCVDRAIAARDESLFGAPGRGDRLLWATTTATRPDGVWTYVVAINTATDHRSIVDRFDLDREATVFDWRRGTASNVVGIEVQLTARDWALYVVSPPGRPAASDLGDATKYVVVESATVPTP